MLRLPPTIRTARPDEVPKREDILTKIAVSSTANIVQGYVVNLNKAAELPFTFFSEINIDNQNLWLLFKTLLLQLPEEICLVYNFKDEEPSYSEYADKYEVLNKLESYRLEITQDGFLEIGALFNDNSRLEEVFIRSPKYVQYWGTNEGQFRSIMTEFGLPEIAELDFIDQYPLVTETLRLHRPDALETAELMAQLSKIGRVGE